MAAARGAPEVRAMPARRMGCWILRRVVRGVVMDMVGGWFGGRKVKLGLLMMWELRMLCFDRDSEGLGLD